jgi:FAD-dependent urate hydroxylase
METCDVAIVGAGPYGLSAGAYLREIPGVETKVFGQPMDFWKRCMPPKMLLRSRGHAMQLAAPKRQWSLDTYVAHNGNKSFAEPLPCSDFIHYGQWFHDRARINSDPRKVVHISRIPRGYQLSMSTGENLRSTRVIVAAGIESYAYKPESFSRIPPQLVSHASELRDYEAFRNKHVIVIGGGQSALESAAFLHDGGAHVEILVRSSAERPAPWRLALLKRMVATDRMKFLYGRGRVGPAGVSLLVQRPSWYSRLSKQRRTIWDRRSSKLGFSFQLVPHMNGTQIHYGQTVDRADVHGECVTLRMGDGTQRRAHHIVLGTGYHVNVAKCPFLSPRILHDLHLVNGYPVLGAGLESSSAGLHFLGAPAAYSFGPLLRFVAGAEFAASTVARKIQSVTKHSR